LRSEQQKGEAKMRNLALMWVLAACLLGCGGMDKDAKDKADSAADTVAPFTDTRDGKVYKIVKIGSQIWFAENLNYAAEGSVCYGNKVENCNKYGRLYNWETALNACPAGTHLPSDDEWTRLVDYAGGAGTKLKSSTGWKKYKNIPVGTDEYGFSALPGGEGGSNGYFYSNDYFDAAGYYGVWWSATEYYAGGAWSRNMWYDIKGVVKSGGYKNKIYLYSVRCVLDDEKERRK
jgi:uncharacterized protein (TIGR02145 family)